MKSVGPLVFSAMEFQKMVKNARQKCYGIGEVSGSCAFRFSTLLDMSNVTTS